MSSSTVPDILRYAGFAEENDPGTAEDAKFHVDITSGGLDVPSDTEISYDGGLGRGKNIHRPGFYSPEGDIVWAVDIRTLASALKWALGGYEFTADEPDVDTNLHEIWATDERILPSFTARLGKDLFEHVFKGCVVGSFELSVSDEFAELTMSVVSQQDEKATLKAIADLSLPDEYPLSFVDSAVRLGSGLDDISPDVREFTLSVDNGTDSSQGRGLGSRFPSRIPANERETTIDMTLFFGNLDQLERFWGGSDGPAAEGTAETELEFDLDAGDDGLATFRFPRVLFTSVAQAPSGRSEIEQSISAQAYLSTMQLNDGTTDVSTDMLVSVNNAEDEVTPPSV